MGLLKKDPRLSNMGHIEYENTIQHGTKRILQACSAENEGKAVVVSHPKQTLSRSRKIIKLSVSHTE